MKDAARDDQGCEFKLHIRTIEKSKNFGNSLVMLADGKVKLGIIFCSSYQKTPLLRSIYIEMALGTKTWHKNIFLKSHLHRGNGTKN